MRRRVRRSGRGLTTPETAGVAIGLVVVGGAVLVVPRQRDTTPGA